MSIESEAARETTAVQGSLERAFQATLRIEAIPYLFSITDAVTILLASLLSGYLYHRFMGIASPDLKVYFAIGLIASFIYCVRFGRNGYYDFEQASKPAVEIVEVLASWLSAALLLSFLAFLVKISASFSRGSFLLLMSIAPIGLLAMRKFEKHLLSLAIRHGAVGRRNVVVVGDSTETATLDDRDLLALFGASEVARFTLTDALAPELRRAEDIATFNAVASFVRKNSTSEILLAVPWHDTARIEFLREQLKVLPVWSRLLPDAQIRSLTNYASSARQKVLSIEIQRAPLRASSLAVKRAADLGLGLIALILLSPILLVAAVAIKLDGPGPIIFRQHRRGFNGQHFLMLKFRSMRVQENGENGATVIQARRNDTRVTRVGAFLRATSIDELPQLVNVLRGDMSLIGPRPHAIAHDNYFEKVLEDYAFRHHVKPGMTGWAQVNGLRGATPTVDLIAKRVKMDLWYINNWSFWLDLQIIIKTVFEVLRKRNAY